MRVDPERCRHGSGTTGELYWERRGEGVKGVFESESEISSTTALRMRFFLVGVEGAVIGGTVRLLSVIAASFRGLPRGFDGHFTAKSLPADAFVDALTPRLDWPCGPAFVSLDNWDACETALDDCIVIRCFPSQHFSKSVII